MVSNMYSQIPIYAFHTIRKVLFRIVSLQHPTPVAFVGARAARADVQCLPRELKTRGNDILLFLLGILSLECNLVQEGGSTKLGLDLHR